MTPDVQAVLITCPGADPLGGPVRLGRSHIEHAPSVDTDERVYDASPVDLDEPVWRARRDYHYVARPNALAGATTDPGADRHDAKDRVLDRIGSHVADRRVDVRRRDVESRERPCGLARFASDPGQPPLSVR
jgi:hypothetical protein